MRTVSKVLWRDCDPAGIMYYGSVLRFVEECEHELMAAAGLDYVDALQQGLGFPRVHFECDYHQPIHAGEALACEMRLARIGRSSLTLGFTLGIDGAARPSASGEITMVCIDWQAQTPRAVPGELRNALEDMAADAVGGDDDGALGGPRKATTP